MMNYFKRNQNLIFVVMVWVQSVTIATIVWHGETSVEYEVLTDTVIRLVV